MADLGIRAKLENPIMLFLYITLFTSALILFGCVTAVEKIQEWQQRIIKEMRKPGEKMVVSPQDTSKNYSCMPNKQITLIVEEVDVVPDSIFPGERINQRIRYAMCSYPPSTTVHGKIVRSILFKGKFVFRKVSDYEFKPGTWTVDVFIDVPHNAEVGVYAVDITIAAGLQTIRRSDTFILKIR